MTAMQQVHSDPLMEYVPAEFVSIKNLQRELPRIAKNRRQIRSIETALGSIPSEHNLYNADARSMEFLGPESVHLILTSPPYWTLKKYHDTEGQLGFVAEYEVFLKELDRIWQQCFDALVPGGRLICVVGDVCLSRRKNNGRHTVVPLHASIQEHCRDIGFDNLAPVIWHKISNAAYEVAGNSSFLGKPYEPNAVIKNDIEFILMQRKPGGYRSPSPAKRILSIISEENHHRWFQQIWAGLTGASTRNHPAPFPLVLAERLIRMFSFAGDTVLDPFSGTGTTTVAAAKWGRNSIGIEIDREYFDSACDRVQMEASNLFTKLTVNIHRSSR
jgi:DNA modification methylase